MVSTPTSAARKMLCRSVNRNNCACSLAGMPVAAAATAMDCRLIILPITPAAEFNIYVDPQAADVVFKSGIPIVMMPLDVTHKALTTAKRTQAFRQLGTKVGTATAEMLEFFERFDEGPPASRSVAPPSR